MFLRNHGGPHMVTLPDGSVMTRADLPPADTCRWVARRKAAVVRAVQHGLISRADALDRYAISDEEFAQWCSAVALHGERALRVTRLAEYRDRNA